MSNLARPVGALAVLALIVLAKWIQLAEGPPRRR